MKVSPLLLLLLVATFGFSQINKPMDSGTQLPSIAALRTHLQSLFDSRITDYRALPATDLVSQAGNYPEYYKTSLHLVSNDRANITVYRNGSKKIVQYSALLGSYTSEEDSQKVYDAWMPLLLLAVPEFNIAIDTKNQGYHDTTRIYQITKEETTGFSLLHYQSADELWYVVLQYRNADNEDLALLDEHYLKAAAEKKSNYYKAMTALEAKEYNKAFALFAKTVKTDPDNYRGRYQLGLLYRYGLGTRIDQEKAKVQFEAAGTMGYALASYEMGLFHKQYGTARQTMEWYAKAAQQGLEVGKNAYDYETGASKTTSTTPELSNQTSDSPVLTLHQCQVCKGSGKLPVLLHDGHTDNTIDRFGKPVTCYACGGKGHQD